VTPGTASRPQSKRTAVYICVRMHAQLPSWLVFRHMTPLHLAAYQDTCSFSGAWRGKPSSMARVYYVSSYFWDRAVEAGIITDEAAVEWATSPAVCVQGTACRRHVGWCVLMHRHGSVLPCRLTLLHASHCSVRTLECRTLRRVLHLCVAGQHQS
jgi:hypothetical protein